MRHLLLLFALASCMACALSPPAPSPSDPIAAPAPQPDPLASAEAWARDLDAARDSADEASRGVMATWTSAHVLHLWTAQGAWFALVASTPEATSGLGVRLTLDPTPPHAVTATQLEDVTALWPRLD